MAQLKKQKIKVKIILFFADKFASVQQKIALNIEINFRVDSKFNQLQSFKTGFTHTKQFQNPREKQFLQN